MRTTKYLTEQFIDESIVPGTFAPGETLPDCRSLVQGWVKMLFLIGEIELSPLGLSYKSKNEQEYKVNFDIFIHVIFT